MGFAGTVPSADPGTSVHPHTYGVYKSVLVSEVSLIGPSPCAWGLLCQHSGHDQERRSIPTYVGFTSSTPGPSGTPSVHPHVREVYVMDNVYLDTYYGPSPRAWGLHSQGLSGDPVPRSIPTYVGFISCSARKSFCSCGSSPRAWGLY